MSWFGWFRRSRSDKVTQGVDLGEGAPTFLLGGRQRVPSARQIEQTLAMAQRDVDSSRFRCVAPFYVTFGQRV